jgi:hypothetical protein
VVVSRLDELARATVGWVKRQPASGSVSTDMGGPVCAVPSTPAAWVAGVGVPPCWGELRRRRVSRVGGELCDRDVAALAGLWGWGHRNPDCGQHGDVERPLGLGVQPPQPEGVIDVAVGLVVLPLVDGHQVL